MVDLGLVLPIVCINQLCQRVELGESGRLSNTGDLILDTIRQTVIKVVPEGTFSIALDLHCDSVELSHILGDTLTVLHGQVVELVLHISDRVV